MRSGSYLVSDEDAACMRSGVVTSYPDEDACCMQRSGSSSIGSQKATRQSSPRHVPLSVREASLADLTHRQQSMTLMLSVNMSQLRT